MQNGEKAIMDVHAQTILLYELNVWLAFSILKSL